MNPYGETKRIVERAMDWYGRARDLRWVALRYFNAAGAEPEDGLGEDHYPETLLIPLVLEGAIGRRTIDIYGNDYPTPDGTCVRDYIHVSDLAEAHVLALEYLMSGKHSIALNLGTGEGHSVTSPANRVLGWRPQHSSLESIISSAWKWHSRQSKE